MRKQILILLLLRLRLRRRRLDYYYYYDYYLRLLVLPTTTTTTAITMHWLLASLLVLPPRTGPLPLVGLKRDARRTELVSSSLCLSACVWPIQSCTICAWSFLAARVLLTSRYGTAIFLTIIFALFCERVVPPTARRSDARRGPKWAVLRLPF